VLILRDLVEAPRRFCELEESLEGISPNTLVERLRSLEEEGLIVRREYAEIPPRVEYALSERGLALVPILELMREYGERYLAASPFLAMSGTAAK